MKLTENETKQMKSLKDIKPNSDSGRKNFAVESGAQGVSNFASHEKLDEVGKTKERQKSIRRRISYNNFLKPNTPDFREQEQKLSKDSWKEHFAHSCSIVQDILLGQLVYRLECTSCSNVFVSFEYFKMLELDLPKDPKMSLQKLLEFNERKIKCNEYCKVCKETRSCFFSRSIYKLPQILVLLFRRSPAQTAGNPGAESNNCIVEMNLDGEDLVKFEHGSISSEKRKYQPYFIVVITSA